ncbi:hypothetical protein, partial [Pseudomonas aeruginosa]
GGPGHKHRQNTIHQPHQTNSQITNTSPIKGRKKPQTRQMEKIKKIKKKNQKRQLNVAREVKAKKPATTSNFKRIRTQLI